MVSLRPKEGGGVLPPGPRTQRNWTPLVLAIIHRRLRQTLAQTGLLLANFGRLRWNEVRQSSSLSAPGALRLPYGAVIAAGTLAVLAFYR